MTTTSRILITGLTGLFLFSCQELDIQPDLKQTVSFKADAIDKSMSAARARKAGGMDVIDFEDFSKGEIVSEAFSKNGAGPVKVWGHNPDFPGQNAAMIFNSATPQSGTVDLGTPNEDFGGPGIGSGGEKGSKYANRTAMGNLLIITQDFDAEDPDDADGSGCTFTFDFSELENVTILSLDIIDVEESKATVTFYDEDGDKIGSTFNLPDVGDNGVHTFKFGNGVSGVEKMEVVINGSAAIDNVGFTSGSKERQKGNNGWGNGEDPAPGNSLANQPKFEDPDTGASPCNSPKCKDGDR